MDAFYQAFKNARAVEFVLKNFFANNGGHAWVVLDAGADFSPVLKQFGGLVTFRHAK